MLRIFHANHLDKDPEWIHLLPDITLSIQFHPTDPELALIAGMGGVTRLIRILTGDIVGEWTHHHKYIISALFSHDGKHFVSASHDKTVNVYKQTGSRGLEFTKMDTHHLEGVVESMVQLTPPSSSSFQGYPLIVFSVRNDHHLYVLDWRSPTVLSKKNMNSNGDNWVSFTALHLSASPDGRHILVITDTPAGRILVYSTDNWNKKQDIWGSLKIDQFSNPRGIWLDNENFIVGDDEGEISLWNLHRPSEQGRLKAHSSAIRGLSKLDGLLFSGSFDKSVQAYQLDMGLNR